MLDRWFSDAALSRHRLALLILLLVLLIAQLAAVSYTFPISEIFSEKPLATVDHAYHQYQSDIALDLARQDLIVGYDTTFGAGYLGGAPYNLSGKLPAITVVGLSPFLDSVKAYKLYVFIAYSLAPTAIVLAAIWLRLPTTAIALAGITGLALWWASAFRWYSSVGMVSFVLVSFFTLPLCVLLEHVMRAGSHWLLAVLLGFTGGLALLAHPLFPIPMLFFALALLIVTLKQYTSLPTLGKLTTAAMIALASNWIWIRYLVSQSGLANQSVSAKYQALVAIDMVYREMLGLWGHHAMGAKLYPLLLLGSALGLFFVRSEHARWVRASVLTWAILVLFAALGAALPGVDALQPNRFAPVGYIFLIIPFSMGIYELIKVLSVARPRFPFAYLPAAVVGIGSLICLTEVWREISYGDHAHYGIQPPEVRGLGPLNRELLTWLDNNTDSSGRVLFETSLGRIHDRSHIAGLLAQRSDREFIGGPYPFLFFAGFWDGFVFGHRIEEITPERFLQYLDLYNVRWILAHSTASKRYLSSVEGIEPDREIGPVQTFVVARSGNFFLDGQGEIVRRGMGYLVLRSTQGPGHPLTLKYHQLPGLRAVDGSEVEGVYRLDDPQPFVRVIPKGSVVELRIHPF